MTEIRFYHLQKQTLDQALPKILEKAYQTDRKIVARLADQKEVERMNALLWTYNPNVFLPHGSQKDGHADKQPIWLTHKNENPNKAKILILTQNVSADDLSEFDLCCEILDGYDNNAVSAARQKWKAYRDSGHDVTYWHQDENGKWEKKS